MDDIRQQIDRLQAEIARHESELTGLEAAVLDIQRELSEFTERYDRLVQPMVTRLEIVRAAIAELEEQQGPPPQLAGYVLSSPEPTWTPPPDYVPVEEQFRRAWQVPSSETAPPDTGGKRAPVEEEPESDLKHLYRQLARRYHPDLSADPVERERRNRLMAEINQAYTERNIDALQALATQPKDASVDEPLATLQLRQLQQVHNQLDRRITRLKQERSDLLNSDLMWLKVQATLAAKQGRDLLREMADQLEHEYLGCLDRLDELRGA